jgi:hypothetical protein
LVLGLLAGLVSVGIAQYTVLKSHCHRAGWWVVVNIIGWIASILGGLYAAEYLIEQEPLQWYVTCVMIGLMAGVITGTPLVWLLRQPIGRMDQEGVGAQL